MPNTLYPKGKEKILLGEINMRDDTIRAVLLSNTYAYAAGHEFLSQISAHKLGDSVLLENKSVKDGVFDADDLTFVVPSGSTVRAIALYKDTGLEGSSSLLDYIDTVAGLPMVTTGADVVIRWDQGAYRIFSL